ncbi:hypothetical protein [Tissierella sp. P1]|uniref:methylated-DNA--[protein]-cysteine S-methyltransferase n=1 Tax=Tissierella sp. P1 TaxID=1280483 RepID=UPI0019114C98
MSPKYYSFESPIGKLTVYFTEKGIIALSFQEEDNLKYIERYYDTPIKVEEKDYNYHEEIIKYLEGELKEFTMPISFKGTPFQESVWKELLNIPMERQEHIRNLLKKSGVLKDRGQLVGH